jgi:UDP-N-acetylglucosamine--N-acetylmuramyl-(pentapeptide) pyrophosphoryl-undecaprenol N-acetylglucosamine transferase
MVAVYLEADLAVCRAGATTIAELCIMGVPAILVPYPYAADDHQRRNAEAMQAAGGAVLILDRELTVERLAAELTGLLDDPARLCQMGAAARALGRPEASRLVVEQCAVLARRSGEARNEEKAAAPHRIF